MSKRITGVPAEIRRKEILEMLGVAGHISVPELCEHFGLSPATVRNDLNALEKQRCLRRTHGGALSLNGAVELTTLEKQQLHAAEKRRIAQLALPFVHPGQVIGIDTGTTTFELAQLLGGIEGLTVVTNDLHIASLLENNAEANVILLGGTVRKHFHCTVGQSVLRQLDSLYVDTLFLATNAIDLQRGLSTPSIETADVKRKLMENSRCHILLADSSKLGCESFAHFAAIEELDIIISDTGAAPELVEQLRARDVRLILG